MRALLAAIIVGGYAMLGHTYVAVWHSDLTLWNHARLVAPFSPRSFLNYAKALAAEGRDTEAAEMMARASALERKRRQ